MPPAKQSQAALMLRAAMVRHRGQRGPIADRVRKAANTASPDGQRAASTARVARAIVEKLGRPVGNRELLDRLAQCGVTVTGAQPRLVLGSRLRGSGLLAFVRGRGWWLCDAEGVSAPLPPGD